MNTRFVGVVAAFAAIVFVFAVVVLTIAAIQDYQENNGQSFIERAAGIVGIGTLTENEEPSLYKIEITDSDVVEQRAKFVERDEPFQFFRRSEDPEEWLDDLFDGGWFGGEEYFEFEDRIERLPDLPRFRRFEELPFGRFDFEGRRGTEWVDQLVERGIITEEDADEFKSWFDELPNEFDDRIPDFSGDRDFEFDSDDGRFRFRWRWNQPDDDWFFESDPEYDKDAENGI